MCYRGTIPAETDAEDMEMTTHEEPGRFGERNYQRQRRSTPKSVRTSTDTQGVISRVKTLLHI